MLIGLLSDTHDRLPAIEQAVARLNAEGVDAVLHLGDFVSPFSLAPLKRLTAPLYAVFGNNDGEKEGLSTIFAEQGWDIGNRPRTVILDGHRIALLHEPGPIDRYAVGDCSLIAYGHLHTRSEERRGETLIVNPGEGCGWVTGVAGFAVVDLSTGEVKFHDIDI
jgi:putative phosphoesterase